MRTETVTLRCPACRRGRIGREGDEATCASCHAHFPVRHGIIDLLGTPTGPVAMELQGLANENDVAVDDLESVKFLRVPHVETLPDLMNKSRDEAVRYYQQTAAAYFEALGRASLDADMAVAEVGSERTLWKLRAIEDLCRTSLAINVFFHVGDEPVPPTSAVRVLGDMQDLPIETASLDLVIYSATLHHSADIAGALRETARVLRVGGRAIVVNEPIAGRAKGLGGDLGHDRHDLVHEDQVSFRQWHKAIGASGLRADHFIPAWFTAELRDASQLPHGTRFRTLAKALSPAVGSPLVADLGRTIMRVPAQALLGMPLNAVLWRTP